MDSMERFKQQAAYEAVKQVTSGMVVGLGTGSTAKHAVIRIGELIRNGELKEIVGIPSSVQTEALAREAGIPLTTFDDHPRIDLTIDGADEVDPNLNLIKGGGGALLREKILAQASRRNIIIVDESKLSEQLGTLWSLPVEVIPFARRTEEGYLSSLGATPNLRTDEKGRPVLTDQNNLIFDAAFGPIEDPEGLAAKLNDRSGIMAQGLFIGLAHEVIIAGSDNIRHMTP
jgi:ribose 5-phosphate isomerase A